MKKVLVTGARGLLGRHVVDSLARRGFEVHALTRSMAQAPWQAGAVHWHAADVLDRAATASLVQSLRADGLIHLAWETTHPSYWNDPVNLDWTAASLDLARAFARAGGRRLVVAGSCAEYSWRGAEPLAEGLTPLEPRLLYGQCKNALRAMLETWAPANGVSMAWGRIFNIFGPGEGPLRLIPKVVNCLLRGEELPFDEGRDVRDFMFAGDAGDAFAALYGSGLTGAVNIASGDATPIRDVVSLIAAHTGAVGQVHFGARPSGPDSLPIVAHVERLKAELGWKPEASLEERLAQTCGWWRSQGMLDHRTN